MRSQLDHLGGRAQPLAHFRRVNRRTNRRARLAPRLRRAKIHDQVNHLVEFERFQIAFTHREYRRRRLLRIRPALRLISIATLAGEHHQGFRWNESNRISRPPPTSSATTATRWTRWSSGSAPRSIVSARAAPSMRASATSNAARCSRATASKNCSTPAAPSWNFHRSPHTGCTTATRPARASSPASGESTGARPSSSPTTRPSRAALIFR